MVVRGFGGWCTAATWRSDASLWALVHSSTGSDGQGAAGRHGCGPTRMLPAARQVLSLLEQLPWVEGTRQRGHPDGYARSGGSSAAGLQFGPVGRAQGARTSPHCDRFRVKTSTNRHDSTEPWSRQSRSARSGCYHGQPSVPEPGDQATFGAAIGHERRDLVCGANPGKSYDTEF